MHVNSSIMDPDCSCIDSARMLSPFLVVDFTDDNIPYKSNCVQQNPNAQDYYEMQQPLLAQKLLFDDPDFPTTTHSILGHASKPKSNIQWLRPAEIITHPKFFVEQKSLLNLEKRSVLHGFLTTAMVSLTTNDRAFRRTVPMDNSFDDKLYTGMFHFRFWQYGRWFDVVIDDRLPVMDGQLIFMRPTQQNEFWLPLLEKAYAKLKGSFGAIVSSSVIQAMQDFTGGITERFALGNAITRVDHFYDTIQRKLDKGCIMAATKVHNDQRSKKQSQYAHSVLKLTIIESMLICLQTPLEELVEITYLYNKETADSYSKCWMQFDEFVRIYDRIEICNVFPDSMENADGGEYSWRLSCIHGAWILNSTAGGPKKNPESFWKNPQYIVQLGQPDPIDDSGMCHIVISLGQKPRSGVRLSISFVVYRISANDFRCKPVPMTFSKKNEPTVVAYPKFSSGLEVTKCMKTLPGILLIVPCTEHQEEEGEFFLRIYSCPRSRSNENVKSPALNDKIWHSIVRNFFSMADPAGSIDQEALASMLSAYFLNTNPKRGKRFWKIITRKRSPSISEANSSPNEVINYIARCLFYRMQLDPADSRMSYLRFKQTAHVLQQWKEMFDFYDGDRSGSLEKKQLVKSLRRSLDMHTSEDAGSLLKIVEKAEIGKIFFEDFVMFLLDLELNR